MAIYYPDILDEGNEPQAFEYSEKDVMLYALGLGLGQDPMDEAELPFVYEKNLKVVPTVATVLGWGLRGAPLPVPPGHRPSTPNRLLLVHAECKIELHKSLPGAGRFVASRRTIGAFDKGKDKGAITVKRATWVDDAAEPVVTITDSFFCRGDGGFGGPMEGQTEPHTVPDRSADTTVRLTTRPDQALLYRLNGDRNPLHADPESARKARYPRPILHGLCTYGITCRAVLQTYANYEPEAILSHQVRFSAPVFPGDTLSIDLWRDGNIVSFEARVEERQAKVIKNGKTVLR